jgi:trimeric autotransporter adhesin
MPTTEEQLGALNTAVAALAAAVGVSQTTMNANVATAAGSATSASNSAAEADADRIATGILRDAMQTLSSSISSIALAAGSGPATSLQYPALAALLATATDIVDVFVYDTRRDSDFGEWTAKCSRCSWWSEALGTATRGARRDFPKIAAIVLRAVGGANTLVIYDLTDLDVSGIPRMWMSFTSNNTASSGVAALWTSTGSSRVPTAVFALNGRIWVSVGGSSGFGVLVIDFPNDRMRRHVTTISAPPGDVGVANRNTALTTWPAITGTGIADALVNHVHARVLPGAPLDGAGLPIPTVAVATAAGASIIHPNGAVYDITDANGFGTALFVDDTRLSVGSSSAGAAIVTTGPIPYADVAVAAWRLAFYSATTSGSAGALRFAGTSRPTALTRNAIGSGTGGLTLIAEDPANPAGGMMAYAATNHATGWMPGDCRLASLCDTTTGNIVGVASITDTFGYVDTAAMLAVWTDGSTGTGAATLASGAASFSRVDSGNRGAMRRSFTTVVGQTYLFRFSNGGTGGLFFTVGTTSGGSQISSTTHAIGEGGWVPFVATTTTTWVQAGANTNGQTTTFDNFSFDLVVTDRSYRGRGLIPVGTIGRNAAASGSDVVMHGPFTTSNYYTQPFNPDLEYGEGDFSIFGGFVLPATAAQETLIARDSPTTGARFVVDVAPTTSVLRFTISDGTNSATVSSTSAVDDGVLRLWGVVVRGSNIEMWVNGVREATASSDSVGSLNNAAGIFRVGVNAQTTNPFSGTQAIIRASAYAPTLAQIAKIYRDDLPRFGVDARSTLGGASNAIQKMAFDEAFSTLIVGTGDGVSEFNGLTRVNYLDTSNVSGLTNDNIQAVGGAAGFRVIAGTAQAVARRDATNGIDAMNRYGPRAPVRDGLMRSTGRTMDATPLNLAPRIFVGEREHIRGEVRVIGKMVGAAATQRFSALMEFVATRDAGGNITLNLAAANQKDPLWNGTAAIDGTVETTSTTDAAVVADTASQTLALQVTGIAATTIAWTADWTFTRIAEDSSYAA